mmetsp:Transcript_38607/g.60232  ORF Transcript_38607/g.60232 Transcript_38607/m.60232 type:complete len:574 (-) Transcript_38607:184-1905(-)|eukprot:CAMPEP_0184304958 /NCGR_PEP_ID=MMETSP1049-20130417/14353_1 /TAXON_ID=77928 /ORGANISM="Proteomonas sulcata, Strain CCMP704" /LENGTH=573 /DNA_ID=CAMNT_0026616915 /DNA_START=99 /DNA_END=1820 /DNA_ORIENTATION=+
MEASSMADALQPRNLRAVSSAGVARVLGISGSVVCLILIAFREHSRPVELEYSEDPGLRGSGNYVGQGLRWDPSTVEVQKPGLSFAQEAKLHSHREQQRWASRFGGEATEAAELQRSRSLEALRRAVRATAPEGIQGSETPMISQSALAWVRGQLARAQDQQYGHRGDFEVWHPDVPQGQAGSGGWHPAGTLYGARTPTPQLVRSELHPSAPAPVPQWVRDDEEPSKKDCGGDCVPRSMVAPFNPLSAYETQGTEGQGPPRWVRDDQGGHGTHPSFAGGSQAQDAAAFKALGGQVPEPQTPNPSGLQNARLARVSEDEPEHENRGRAPAVRKDDTLGYLLKALSRQSASNKAQLGAEEQRAQPQESQAPQPQVPSRSSSDIIARQEQEDQSQDHEAEQDLLALERSGNGDSPMHDALSQVVSSMDAKHKKQLALKRILDSVENAQVAAEKNNKDFRSLLHKFGVRGLGPGPTEITESDLKKSGDVEAQLAIEEKKEKELQENDRQLADELDEVIAKAKKAEGLRDQGEAQAERILASKYERDFGSDASQIVPQAKPGDGEDTTGTLKGLGLRV